MDDVLARLRAADLPDNARDAIAAWIEEAVDAGRVGADERLPTVRDLAELLAASTTTVAAAYRQLAQRGVTVGRGRSGTFIAPSAQPRGAGRAPVGGLVDLASGKPDPALLPDLQVRVRNLRLPDTSYDSPTVLARLAVLAEPVLAGVAPSDAGLLVASGALDAIERGLAAWLRPGDLVGIEDPGWTALLDLVRALRLQPVALATDDRGLLPEALAGAVRRLDALVVTPRFHNPTGAVVDAARAGDLRDVLDGADLLLVEDDHAGLVAGAGLHSLTGHTSRWLYVQSLSKSLGPDLRLALVRADPETAARWSQRQSVGAGWVSTILQSLAADVLARPATTTLLATATAAYTTRRNAVLEALRVRGVAATGPSGLNVWVPVPDEASVVASAQAAGFAILGGQRFRQVSPPAVRVSVGLLDVESVPALANAVAAAVRPGPGARA